MIDHLEAVQARLVGIHPTHIVWATDAGPYYVLTSPSFSPSDEAAVSSTTEALDFELRVKAVTGTPAGVFTMLRLAREELSPLLRSSRLVVAGRAATIRFRRSEFVDVDDSTTLTGTNRHPAIGVESYRIVSQPTTE